MQGIVCCLVFFFAGIMDSITGGGGLIIIPAMLAVGIPVHSWRISGLLWSGSSDMDKFVEKLRKEGYEDVKFIPTDRGMFMSKKEASLLMLTGSSLLVGKKFCKSKLQILYND